MTSEQEPLAVVRIEEGDVHLLQPFYRTHFPDKPKLNNMALWRWEFVENPQRRDGIEFFVLRGDGEIRGAIGGIRTQLQMGAQQLTSCHPVDFFVASDCKGLHALRLFRRVLESAPVLYASYVSADAARLFEKAGFLNLNDDLRVYHYTSKPKRGVRSSLIQYGRAWVVYLARLGVRLGLGVAGRLRQRGRLAYWISDQLVGPMVPAFDVNQHPDRIGLVKDFAYLAWRYDKSPALQSRFFSQSRDGVANCLVVVHERPQERSVVILDIVRGPADSTEVIRALLKVIAHYSGEGYYLISTACLNKTLDMLLAKVGFSSQPSDYRFMFYAKDKALKQQLTDPSRWDFLLGDTDVY